VSKFHLIWSTIAQESNLGRKGQILRENHVFQRPPTRQFLAPPDNVRCGTEKVQPSVLRSRNPQSDNFHLYRTISDPTGQYPAPPNNVLLRVSVRRSFIIFWCVQLIPFFCHCICNFEGITFLQLVGVFITFLQGLGFELGTWASSCKRI
jgi:hypothetical protein